MNIEFTAEQQAIRDAVLKLCAQFDDAYWLNKDTEGSWPHEFHKAFADACDDWCPLQEQAAPDGRQR